MNAETFNLPTGSRKPVQIATSPMGRDAQHTVLMVLCDDGSIWTRSTVQNKWVPLPPLPSANYWDKLSHRLEGATSKV